MLLFWLVFIQLMCGFYMLGLIFSIQFVHYPMFKNYAQEYFTLSMQEHQKRISPIVMGPMIIELGSAVYLLWLSYWTHNTLLLHCFFNVLCLFIIWASTVFLQVPLHMKCLKRFDKKTINKLVQTNLIRTVFWLLKSILCSYVLYQSIKLTF